MPLLTELELLSDDFYKDAAPTALNPETLRPKQK